MVTISITLGRNQNVGSFKIRKFTRKMYPNMVVGFRKTGVILTRQVQALLSGKGRGQLKISQVKGRYVHRDTRTTSSNPYPGVLSGKLRGSVRFKMRGNTVNTLGLSVGPNTVYAARQNFGFIGIQAVSAKMRGFLHAVGIHLKRTTTSIRQFTPERPYMLPAMLKQMKRIIDVISRELFSGLD